VHFRFVYLFIYLFIGFRIILGLGEKLVTLIIIIIPGPVQH